MNTTEIDDVLRNNPHTRNVFTGVYARNRLPREIKIPFALVGNTDPDNLPGRHWVAVYVDANGRGEYYDPTGTPPFQRAFLNFLNKHCNHWTHNGVRVQEKDSIVCGHHCIFYLVHRCAGRTMTDVTRTLGTPKEATDIVVDFINKISESYHGVVINEAQLKNKHLFKKIIPYTIHIK